MQNLLGQYYPPFTVERPGHETAYAVTDAFEVTPTTLSVEPKRAIIGSENPRFVRVEPLPTVRSMCTKLLSFT